MTAQLFAFYGFALVTALAALGVITLRNPVHAVLSLILAIFSTACLWLLLQAEFLGVVLVLVYVGAVMILFLFVVMMLDINSTPLREGFARYFPIGIGVAAIMFFEMLGLLGVWKGQSGGDLPVADPALAAGASNIQWIGNALFTRFMLPFEIAAVILTVAIVVAVMLTLRRREGVKTQDPSRQVMVRREDRVRLIQMKAEKAPKDGQEGGNP
jgi:NADH-quinone oxidoreductase subunit J